jgi:pyruvate/2-oxoglutarate dehydrogenase complex dihydrolipoamide dehydrogenase (E3) component
MPTVPGLEEAAFTTDQVFNMTEIPESVLVTDPGYIGVEMAFLLNVFGSKVTIAVPTPRILPAEDQIPASVSPSPCASAVSRSLPARPWLPWPRAAPALPAS